MLYINQRLMYFCKIWYCSLSVQMLFKIFMNKVLKKLELSALHKELVTIKKSLMADKLWVKLQ